MGKGEGRGWDGRILRLWKDGWVGGGGRGVLGQMDGMDGWMDGWGL